MANSEKTEIGLGAAKTIVCLVTLFTAMPAFARSASPSGCGPNRVLCGGKVTIDQRLTVAPPLIAAKGARTKDLIGAYLIRGADYLTRNDIDNAIANFSELIRIDPQSGGAFANRGEACRRKGVSVSPSPISTHAIALRPRGSIRLVQPRDYLQRQGRSGSRHRRLQSGDPAQFARCLVLQQSRQFLQRQKAILAARWPITIRRSRSTRTSRSPISTAAPTGENMGHDTPAFADLNNSIRLDPNYAAAYSNRARLFRDARQNRTRARRLRPVVAARSR